MNLEQVQQKIYSMVQHTDQAVGYTVAGGLGSAPIWVNTLTGYLQLVAIVVAIGVGVSTWRLNRAKRKRIEKSK